MAAARGGIWRPYKELQAIVERSLYKKRPEVYHELEVALKKFKPDFISLLKNPAKNTDHREQLKKAPITGLQLAGHSEKQKFPEQFVQEALILSDILELNEFVCVDLLLAGEQQQPNFPGLTRGLVAVLLYHDGRRCLVSALRTLTQARGGITWTLGLYEDLTQLVTKFTDDLLEEGLTTTILQQLDQLDVQKELDKLERGQAIGDERHKQQLIDFITDQRQLLAECLFCFACQSPLPRRDCLQLLSFLRKCPATDADGSLDSVTLTLLMTMLYCLNVDPLDEAAEIQSSIREETFPMLSDPSFIPEFHQEISQQGSWENQGMCACVRFAWALALRSCGQWPNIVGAVEVLEEDEGVLDLAVDDSVFGFLRYCVIGAANFHQEEYFVQRLHSLVTGFIVKMPLKVKELRNHGDEAARILRAHLQDGVEPPAGLPRHFEDFMRMIGDLYDSDPSGLELATEFWCPVDASSATPFSPYNTSRISPALRQRASQKQVSLNKFLRLAGDLLPPPLFVPYMDMLTGLANSPQAAHHCFNLLKSAANGPVSWDHFFGSIKQYYMDLRQDSGNTAMMYGGLTRETGHAHRLDLSNHTITPEELEGLESVLRLTETVADQDEKARLAMCESQAWLPIASLFGLLGCPVPVRFKAQIFSTLAAFAKSPEIASSMWHTLELSQVLQTITPTGQVVQQGGIQVELNELEARSETYPETRAFLKLLNNLTEIPLPTALGSGYRVPGFEPYLAFLRDDVFLKFNSRGYQDPGEKWNVASDVLPILFKLLEDYTPKPEDFVDQFVEMQGGVKVLVPKAPGFSLMTHMLNDTPMLRMLLNVIDGASSVLETLSVTSGIWRPYKELQAIVERSLYKKRPEVYHELEVALKKFKPDFISLLKNPAKNTDHREQLKKAPITGLQLAGHSEKQKFPEQFVQEALILSDILELNEFVCVDLLLAGEQQQPNFPGLTRGLVAVLLYHDGRRCLVSALRTLTQARGGITWTLGLYEDLTQLVTKFTDDLLEEGLTTTILQQLDQLDVQKELDKLERGQAIGDERHKQQLIDFITDQRQLLAECLFCFACQSPLPRRDCLQLLSFLRKCPATDADGSLDSVTLTLLMTMLYCLNVDPLDEAAEIQSSIREETFPMLSDPSFIPEFHQEISQQGSWENQGMCACVRFAWALALRSCGQWPNIVGAVEVLEEDEGVLDLAVDDSVFGFLRYCVIGAANFHQEEYFVQRLHSLVTGFIVKMPLKVKELRNHGDEAARILQAHLQDGVEPPAGLPRHFEDFMRMIGDLYDSDPSGLELATEFWCPVDASSATPFSPYNTSRISPALRQRASQKQVSLNKFLRLAGDLLPPPLFVPYMDMLTGLANSPQAAHHCFNLLKSAANGPVSWDHFFGSIKQYYMDLRQDSGNTAMMYGGLTRETGHAHRLDLSNHTITPEELEGLESVLRLTETVADQDEKARLAMCESQAWLPIASLFGLLGCPVPVRLKAQIFSTLAAFAKSPEIAASMWHTLELSQVLQTVTPTGQVVQQGGIQVELNELEARSETYPVTRAFLKLLNNLTEIPLPTALGSGYRVPGFEPYLAFLRDDVFLKFNSRGYQDPGEKWNVASDVLQILFKLLEGYTPKPEDFVDQFVEMQGGVKVLVPKPPGFTLMAHMLNDTPMLRMLLNVIDGASSALETLSVTSDGREELEKAVLLCLRMVEVALEKQEQFMNIYRSVPQQSAVMVSPMEDLLLSINPQSNTPDYLLKIMRFVSHLHTGAELSLSVIKIMCLVCQSATVQRHLVSLLTANQSVSRQILIGFVDLLEVNEPEDLHEKDEQELGKEFVDEKSYGVSQIRNAVRQNILRLILHSLQHPSPNLAHFLMGYELRKPVSKTNLQDPGVLGASKTCLHASLDLLNRGVDTHHGPSCVTETPKFAELAYQLIYSLCANKDTATPTLRYLRTSHDFLYRHLQHLPFKNLVSHDTGEGQPPIPMLTIVSQQSWLLKTAAIELRMTAQGRQRSHAQRLLGLLMGEPSTQAVLGMTQVPELVPRRLEEDFTATDTSHAMYPDMGQSQTRRKLLAILESVEFTQDVPPPMELNYFDVAVTEKAISSCEQKAEDSGVMFCNVPALHKLLMAEISGVQSTATAGHRNFLIQEVRNILRTVVVRNMLRESLHIKKEAFEAWRRAIEVILASCPADILPRDTRQTVISEVLQDLLSRIADENALPELTSPVSGVILTLMAHLRQCTISLNSSATPTTVLDGTGEGRPLHQAGGSLPVGPSVAILKGLIETVLRSGGGLQRVRANLYAALLYFMQTAPESEQTKERGVMENVLSLYPGQSWDTSILPVLSSYGEPFMDVVCRDSCDGHDVGRMLAFSLLDAIIAVDWQQRWLNYLSLKGYLRHMVEGLAHEDHMLQSMLDPSPEPLKALYIYESKMALLTRVAQSSEGAKVLLQAGLMSRLAECTFLDQRPEHERTAGLMSSSLYAHDQDMSGIMHDSFVPSVIERYRQLLMPALKVTLAILTSLGSQHREAATKVLHFVVSHVDVFISILQDRQALHTSGSLQELGLVTGIMCNMGLTEATLTADEELGQEQIQLRGPLTRIQRLIFGLLPRYCSNDNWEKVIKSLMEQNNEEPGAKYSIVAMETTEKLQRICANVVGYCKTVMNSTGLGATHYQVLFSPSLTDSLSRDARLNREALRPSTTVSSHRPVSLGLPVTFLKKCSDQILQSAELYSQARLKLQNLTELTSDELRELSSVQFNGTVQERLSTQQRHQLAEKCLTQIVRFKGREISSQLYIIENCLFIIWRHLDFYFLHCIPSDEERRMLGGSALTSSRMRRLQDLTSPSGSSFSSDHTPEAGGLGDSVTREEIEALKRESISTLTEVFLKKLVEIEQTHGRGRTRVGFIQVLVRRIKRLVTIHGTPARTEQLTSGLR